MRVEATEGVPGGPVKAGALALIVAFVAVLGACGGGADTATGFALPEGFDSDAGPEGETALVLRDSSAIRGDVCLDLQTIMSLPSRTFTSHDPWLEEERSFTGVHLASLFDALDFGTAATDVVIHAFNGYEVVVPLATVREYDYLLCYQENGRLYEELPDAENKGPLAIGIDYSAMAAVDREVYKFHSVWWVDEIELR